MPTRSTRRLAPLFAAGVIGAGIVTGVLYATGAAGDPTTTVTTVQNVTPDSARAATGINAAAIDAGAAAGVVDITASGISAKSSGFPFSRPGQTQTATGTGFLIDTKGHILTAEHVIAGASSVSVRLEDGTARSAKVLGADRATDAAVLQIDPSGLKLQPLPLGSSQALAVGDPLAVIGDPFGYHRSLSTGVVSALNRTIQAPNGFTIADAIQTDAAVNPGNSGGPVLNARGEVVGITDQIATGGSGADSFTGVGFAVPIDDVKSELSQLKSGAHVTHAYLGVGIGQVTTQKGALISSVSAGGPAAKAGLHTGDLVTAVDGKPVDGPDGLVSATQGRRPGDKLSLTVQRGARSLTMTVTLGNQPSGA